MYQQSSNGYVPRRGSIAVGHPGHKAYTGPNGIDIVSPKPRHPVNLKFHDRPPATPVAHGQRINNSLGRQTIPSTAPVTAGTPWSGTRGMISGVNYFDVSILLGLCRIYSKRLMNVDIVDWGNCSCVSSQQKYAHWVLVRTCN
jgi:hypothetical protein